MIDQNYKPWLIEVNSNPCIETSSSVLTKLIPNVIDNAFRIALDPFFPPPEFHPPKKVPSSYYHYSNKYELVFDEV
jgi:hypothetical protein